MSSIKAALEQTFEMREVVDWVNHSKWHAERSGSGFQWVLFHAALAATIDSHENYCEVCDDLIQEASEAVEERLGDDWWAVFKECLVEYVCTFIDSEPMQVAA